MLYIFIKNSFKSLNGTGFSLCKSLAEDQMLLFAVVRPSDAHVTSLWGTPLTHRNGLERRGSVGSLQNLVGAPSAGGPWSLPRLPGLSGQSRWNHSVSGGTSRTLQSPMSPEAGCGHFRDSVLPFLGSGIQFRLFGLRGFYPLNYLAGPTLSTLVCCSYN